MYRVASALRSRWFVDRAEFVDIVLINRLLHDQFGLPFYHRRVAHFD
jgi:hypothetical protein